MERLPTMRVVGFSRSGASPPSDQTPSFSITVSRLLSYMATGSFDGQVQGLNQLQAQEASDFGLLKYMPNIRGHLLVRCG